MTLNALLALLALILGIVLFVIHSDPTYAFLLVALLAVAVIVGPRRVVP